MDFETYQKQAISYIPLIEAAEFSSYQGLPETRIPTVERNALNEGTRLLEDPSFKDKLCPFLRGVAQNTQEIAAAIIPIMFPMVVAGTISAIPAVAAAVAYIVFKSGIDSICKSNPPPSTGSPA
ncbi:hypothetical protein [Mesorhizobium sp. CN2-181]|uniref:hypothetical protein n=1 Tax=Mesorhizobium yinganensis TaxID=3157707 RepID=UPI0032B7307C